MGVGPLPEPEPAKDEAAEKVKALEEENNDLHEQVETLSRQLTVAQSSRGNAVDGAVGSSNDVRWDGDATGTVNCSSEDHHTAGA